MVRSDFLRERSIYELKSGSHGRNVQVNVDISAAGIRISRLNDGTSEIKATE